MSIAIHTFCFAVTPINGMPMRACGLSLPVPAVYRPVPLIHLILVKDYLAMPRAEPLTTMGARSTLYPGKQAEAANL